jgi:hypothetical protein
MAETMTTDLEAVNSMLACVGEAPINTIVGNFPANIQIAIDLLRTTSRAVQMVGYNFNTEENVELSLDSNGKIPLPSNCLDIDITTEQWGIEPVQRGLFLYDKQNHTFVFTASIKCTIKYFLPWTDLNEPTRNYIKVKAARIFQDQTVGSGEHHQYTAGDEAAALVAFESSDMENEDANIFQNWDVGSILARRRPLITQF